MLRQDKNIAIDEAFSKLAKTKRLLRSLARKIERIEKEINDESVVRRSDVGVTVCAQIRRRRVGYLLTICGRKRNATRVYARFGVS